MSVYGPKATSAPTGAIILHPGDDISALVSAAPAGATFYLEAGVYRGVSLAPKDGQTFIGAEGAILNGSAVLTNWTQSGNLWVIGGQTQQGRVHPGAEFEPGTQMPAYPETVFIDNTPLKPVDSLSKVVPGTFYFDYTADKIYIADSPTGHTVEAGKLTHAFHGSATNVTVQNLVIEKYDPQIQEGAIRGGEGWTIRDNEVRLNYAAGISVAGDGSQIIGNYVHDNGQIGLRGSGNNILVQGNELARNGFWSGISPYWEAGGFKFSDTDNLVVRGNYAHDNKGAGMWTDINNIHTLYEDNVVAHNTINGISHEISYDAIIRNNTLYGNGYGDTRGWGWGSDINIQNSQNVEVYGNRVEMTGGGNGIVLIQQNRGSGTFGTYTTTGNLIHDNTIVDHDGHGYIGGFADYNQSGMLNGTNTWSNNQYFMSDGGGRFQWGGSKTFSQFKEAAHETGSISQSYPDTSGWPTGSPAANDAVLSIATASADKAEGQSGTTPFTFTITRTGDTGSTHSVSWSVAGSGANPTSASDFVGNALPSGTVSFAAGETTKTVTVNVAGDTVVESSEGFTVTLSNPSTGATLGTASAIGTIRNDDTEPPPVDTTAPTIASIAASGTNIVAGSGTLNASKTVVLTATFSEAVIVAGGTPSLALNAGGTATYVGGSGTTALAFSHIVQAGQNAADLAVTSLALNGATIKDAAGNAAILSGAAGLNPAGTLKIDTTAPTVASIGTSGTSITAGSGTVGAGGTVTFSVAINEAVAVTGTPTLALNDGGTATYTSGSGSSSLIFTHVVQVGQNAADLTVTGMALNGGTIRDAAGNAANLAAATNYNPAGTLKVDTATIPPALQTAITGIATSNNAVTLTGTSSPGSQIALYDGAKLVGSVVTNTKGAWSYSGKAAVNATYTYDIISTDLSGRQNKGTGLGLLGSKRADTLTGSGGNDFIAGGAGNDVLTGGAGADTFAFIAAPNANKNLDRITDFTSGTDKLSFARSEFSALAPGDLSPAAFVQAIAAVTHDQHVIYNQATGIVSYDADGSGRGAAIAVAQLTPGQALTVKDFRVV